ncbi:MAG: CcdB family protein [Hydrogenovibrio sp.]
MSQFTVYQNTSGDNEAYPYLIDIQHPILEDLPSRVVIPLARSTNYSTMQIKGLSPVIEFAGEKLILMTHQLGSIPIKELGDPIGSLSHLHTDIVSALDFLISGF